MWPDAIHMAPELRALLPSQGCLRPANPLLLFSELVIHSCLPVIPLWKIILTFKYLPETDYPMLQPLTETVQTKEVN